MGSHRDLTLLIGHGSGLIYTNDWAAATRPRLRLLTSTPSAVERPTAEKRQSIC